MIRIALAAIDHDNWVFARMCDNLNKYCKYWTIHKHNVSQIWPIANIEDYDVILWLPDWRIDLIEEISKKCRNRLILAIRCDVFKKSEKTNAFYSEKAKLQNSCAALAVANLDLFYKLYDLRHMLYYAPGGVDTEKFVPKERPWHNPPIVGWAGSANNQGRESRGLDMIEAACKKLDIPFRPALREDRWRTEDEMVKYYQDEIDIYVDAHKLAGRQNGLLEAGACAKSVVATRHGISQQLIVDRINGFLVDRSIDGIAEGIEMAIIQGKEYCWKSWNGIIGMDLRRTIENNWTWRKHAKIFEKIFDAVG